MRVRNNWNIVIGLAACGFCTSATAQSAQAVTAGELVVEPPTLISLGFEWYIEGDADRDAAVAVAYRRAGEREWRESLPLLRVQNERTFYVETLYYTAPNMFAGSVFELAENTEYEVRFTLTDPDGASGEAQRVVNVRTRAEPQPYAGGNTYHVYPTDFTGPRQEPAFGGLLAAYYRNALGGDWSRAAPPRVQPGDTILVHAGVYKDFDRFSYSHEIRSQYRTCCGTPWDGTFYLTQDGTAERPIAIKAAGDGEVIFDGDGNNVLFNVMGADYTYFEGITFRNTNLAIEAGQKGIAGAMGLSVKHSTFDQVGVAVHSDWSGSKNFYIADNVMNGRNDPTYLIGWFSIWPWNEQPNFLERQRMQSYYAVAIYGSGHVVAYNRVTNFHDGIDHATYGMPDGYPNTPRDRMPVSNDIYGNDVSNMHDNCFETDGGMHNQRVFRNRCFNAAVGAMSPQPIFGGPVYFIRNVVYNSVYGPLKIQADPSGNLGVSEHLRRRDPADHARVEHPLPQQLDPGPESAARAARDRHAHAVELVGLQRLPRERGRRVLVPVELAAGRRPRRLHVAARSAALQDARRVSARDGTRRAQPRGRLLGVRERGAARLHERDEARVTGATWICACGRARAPSTAAPCCPGSPTVSRDGRRISARMSKAPSRRTTGRARPRRGAVGSR